jgi:hypothetical protein
MARRGVSRLGCLVGLLVLAAVAYFGINVGEVYLRNYEYLDAMRQEARFATRRTDAEIVSRLDATADSLGLPEGAHHVTVRRTNGAIAIWADYFDHVELPLTVREVHFTPRAEPPL